MTSLEIQHSRCRKLTFTNVTNCYLFSSEELVDFMSFLLYKSAVKNGINIPDITQQRDMHLVKCNLHGK
jgi:hypothetical protein